MSVDTGMVVVVMISMMYMVLVFGLLFYVKNEWCDLLFRNHTVLAMLWNTFLPKNNKGDIQLNKGGPYAYALGATPSLGHLHF